MRKILFVVLLLLSAIGCFESKEDYVLNADGSGKVTIVGSFETTIPGMPVSTDPKETIKQVKELLEKSKGVDAWSNVSYDRTKEGRVSFQGTAYFPDISKLDLETFGKDAKLNKEGNKLVLLIEEKEDGEPAPPPTKPSPEEVKTQIEQAKKQWQTMKTMMGPMLEKIKQDLTYKLPGPVESSTNLKKIDASTVNIQVDGAKFMAAMDAMMTDEAWLKKQAEAGAFAQGGSGPPMGDEVNERIFGEKGPVKAVVTGPGQPQFDYKSEVAAAKAEYAKLMDKLTKETQQ